MVLVIQRCGWVSGSVDSDAKVTNNTWTPVGSLLSGRSSVQGIISAYDSHFAFEW